MSTFEILYLTGFLRVRYGVNGQVRADGYFGFNVEDPGRCIIEGASFIVTHGIAPETAVEAVKAALETPGRPVTVGTGLPLEISL